MDINIALTPNFTPEYYKYKLCRIRLVTVNQSRYGAYQGEIILVLVIHR
jgi:hypothetical protein